MVEIFVKKLEVEPSKSSSHKNLDGPATFWITVDNNRYGTYVKYYARYKIRVGHVKGSRTHAYHELVEKHIKTRRAWKNAVMRDYPGYGAHGRDSLSINFEGLEYTRAGTCYSHSIRENRGLETENI